MPTRVSSGLQGLLSRCFWNPGLPGGVPSKRKNKAKKAPALEPPAPDLPTLLKEHLQNLPLEVKQAVDKVIDPPKPAPTVANKLKSSVGLLKLLSAKKSALQSKALIFQ